MDLIQAMNERHSVRSYLDKPIEDEKIDRLKQEADSINAESGLNIQLIVNEPQAFDGFMAHYGSFSGCKNYFAVAGKKGDNEKAGYYGERLVLLCQQLGLNTCWVALTYSKGKVPVRLGDGEKLIIVIALGYGATQGKIHKNKPLEKLCNVSQDLPEWFKNGMQAVLTAPTAINQQKFFFTVNGNKVTVADKRGPCSKIDLGIVKYHFEIGAGKENFSWGN